MPAKKTTAKTESADWMARIKGSSHDVFLAGLASLARARKSGGKHGKTDFDSLVTEGRKLEPEMKESLQKTWNELREKSRSTISFKSDGKLQEVFEERVAAVLARLGVPSSKEITDLEAKVDRLLAAQGGAGAKRRTPGVRKAAAKPAAKAPAKKAAKPAAKPARKSAKKTAAAE